MLLTFLSRLMSSLLTVLLFTTIVGFTASQTVLNTNYIESKLQSQNAYDRLSDALSEEISKNANDPTISQTAVAAQLKTILTPDVLKQKIDSTLQQLQAYFQHNGPVPTVDVSDLVQQAQKAGLQIGDDKFSKPVQLTAATKVKRVSDAAKLVSIGTIVAAVLLFLGVLTIAIKRRDYRPLANIVFSLGIMLTLAGAVLLFMPQLLNKAYHIDPTKSPFASLAHDLAVIAMHDAGLRLLIPGIVTLLLGILAKYLLRKHRPKAPKSVPSRIEETPIVDAPTPETPTEPVAPPATPTPTTDPTPSAGPTPGAPARPKRPRKIQL